LRFAVHGPGYPVASPRSHGVPRRDVPGRVHVSVAGETAGRAHETRLALTRLRIHVPARRTPLTGERGTDLLHSAGRLFLQPTHQQAPTRRKDSPVQPGLGTDAPTRVSPRSPSRVRHFLDPEVLDPDYVESVCHVGGDLLGPVLAGVCLASAQSGYSQLYPAPPVRPRPGAGEPALEAPHPLLALAAQSRCCQQLAGRKGSAGSYSAVDADNLSVAGASDRHRNGCEGNVPAPGAVSGDPVGLGALWHCARPTESHPSSLRDAHQPHMLRHAADVPVSPTSPHDTEPFIPASLPPRWPARRVCRVEEGRHRLGEVAQSLLLYHLAACAKPWMLGAGGGELSALFQVAWGALPATAPVLMLLDSQVPYVPGVYAVLTRRSLLGRRWKQTITGHTNTLATTTDIPREVKRAPSLI